MYYIAKLHGLLNPTIVENFEDKELAHDYANIMNQAKKGNYVVLEESEND